MGVLQDHMFLGAQLLVAVVVDLMVEGLYQHEVLVGRHKCFAWSAGMP